MAGTDLTAWLTSEYARMVNCLRRQTVTPQTWNWFWATLSAVFFRELPFHL